MTTAAKLAHHLQCLLVAIALLCVTKCHGSSIPGNTNNCQSCYESAAEKLLSGSVFDDCCQVVRAFRVLDEGCNSGVFDLHGGCLRPKDNFQDSHPIINARCDMETDGGGWTVILRRKQDTRPRINFKRPFEDYEEGFGDLNTEFWYGLTKIHCLTQRADVEMRIELYNDDGTGKNLTYDTFKIAGAEDNYRLTLVSSAGPGFDPMAQSNGQVFSAYDVDNDGWYRLNCALATSQGNGGGWWYHVVNDRCSHTYLTRPAAISPSSNPCVYDGRDYFCYSNVEMKIRARGCHLPVTPCD